MGLNMSSDKIRKNFNKPLSAKRIVVKIGSALLTHKTEAINKVIVERLVTEIAMLSRNGIEVIKYFGFCHLTFTYHSYYLAVVRGEATV